MNEASEQYLLRAIDTLSQSDPITKLLQQVTLGRMKPTDAGLRAITESWLGTYQKVFDGAPPLTEGTILRLDPSPRLQVLIEAGVLTAGDPPVVALRAAFERALAAARGRARGSGSQ